jgi:aspartyl-tRNA(Asn)/glutamyl-tRNA(Gln) amidotransferase subunit A
MATQSQSQALAELTITEAAELLRRKELTSVELTEAVLQRTLETEPIVSAYTCVLGEQALEAARQADAHGGFDGGIRGIPVSLKDLYNMAGVVTTAGSPSRRNAVASTDATVTARLRERGAVITGKTATHEFALGVTTPASRNAWDPSRIPGGSSGGAGASVAVGSSLGAFGTDTGCSIRLPASLNGITGLKPTYGLVGRGGLVPLSWSHDHAGPLARTVLDCAVLLEAVAGLDPRDPASTGEAAPNPSPERWQDAAGRRIGVPANFFFDGVDPEIESAVRAGIDALVSLGAQPVAVEISQMELTLPVVLASSLVEGAAYHRHGLMNGAEFGDEVRTLLKAGALLFGTEYADARRVRTLVKRAVRQVFDDHRLDALITPTNPITALPAGQELYGDPPEPVINHYARLCCPFNITGQPAMSVPCGFSSGGLPIGMQIVGRPFDEETVLHLGHAFQTATGWHKCRPQLALMGTA